jgi:hypothetical protein
MCLLETSERVVVGLKEGSFLSVSNESPQFVSDGYPSTAKMMAKAPGRPQFATFGEKISRFVSLKKEKIPRSYDGEERCLEPAGRGLPLKVRRADG